MPDPTPGLDSLRPPTAIGACRTCPDYGSDRCLSDCPASGSRRAPRIVGPEPAPTPRGPKDTPIDADPEDPVDPAESTRNWWMTKTPEILAAAQAALRDALERLAEAEADIAARDEAAARNARISDGSWTEADGRWCLGLAQEFAAGLVDTLIAGMDAANARNYLATIVAIEAPILEGAVGPVRFEVAVCRPGAPTPHELIVACREACGDAPAADLPRVMAEVGKRLAELEAAEPILDAARTYAIAARVHGDLGEWTAGRALEHVQARAALDAAQDALLDAAESLGGAR